MLLFDVLIPLFTTFLPFFLVKRIKILIFAAEIINIVNNQNRSPIGKNFYFNLKHSSMKTYANRTDEELALLYTAGDNKAFDELLARNQQKLFSYILFVVRDHDMANDIFQDTFIKAITKLQEGKYADSGKFSFWLTRIAHNIIIDRFRRTKSEHIIEPNADNDLSHLSNDTLTESSRESEYVNTQIMDDVRHLMETLPSTQREVVYMRYYQELSFKEIAELTGVSINTSLGRMRYALINMRRMAKQHQILLDMEL